MRRLEVHYTRYNPYKLKEAEIHINEDRQHLSKMFRTT